MEILCEKEATFNNIVKNCYQLLDEWGEKSALHEAIAQQYQPQKTAGAIRKWFSGPNLNIPQSEYAQVTVATCMIEVLHAKIKSLDDGKNQMLTFFNQLNNKIHEQFPAHFATGNSAPHSV